MQRTDANKTSISLVKNWIADAVLEVAYSFSNDSSVIIDGNDYSINGMQKVAHLLKIHNCNKVVVRNVKFMNGNTEIVRQIPRGKLNFSSEKVSVFEILDGGAVVITGKSNVVFENCHFEGNKSIMCGGAVSNQCSGVVTFNNCIFLSNIAGHTGAAIDNLTSGSKLVVENSRFISNMSNQWYKSGFPHGQITVFPDTIASISNSYFSNGSIPIDYSSIEDVTFYNNRYEGYETWHENLRLQKKFSIRDKVMLARKLYWVLPKTIGKVYYNTSNRNK
jgi:hypothetical protein